MFLINQGLTHKSIFPLACGKPPLLPPFVVYILILATFPATPPWFVHDDDRANFVLPFIAFHHMGVFPRKQMRKPMRKKKKRKKARKPMLNGMGGIINLPRQLQRLALLSCDAAHDIIIHRLEKKRKKKELHKAKSCLVSVLRS